VQRWVGDELHRSQKRRCMWGGGSGRVGTRYTCCNLEEEMNLSFLFQPRLAPTIDVASTTSSFMEEEMNCCYFLRKQHQLSYFNYRQSTTTFLFQLSPYFNYRQSTTTTAPVRLAPTIDDDSDKAGVWTANTTNVTS
jgi:hypothetical protein